MTNNSGSVLIAALTATFGIPFGPGALLLLILFAAFSNSSSEIGMNSSIVGGGINGISAFREQRGHNIFHNFPVSWLC